MSPDANPEQNLAPEVKDTRSHPVWGVYDRLRTARGNAWEAVCADRENARGRAELDRLRNM